MHSQVLSHWRQTASSDHQPLQHTQRGVCARHKGCCSSRILSPGARPRACCGSGPAGRPGPASCPEHLLRRDAAFWRGPHLQEAGLPRAGVHCFSLENVHCLDSLPSHGFFCFSGNLWVGSIAIIDATQTYRPLSVFINGRGCLLCLPLTPTKTDRPAIGAVIAPMGMGTALCGNEQRNKIYLM
jgi:hypothetical protein